MYVLALIFESAYFLFVLKVTYFERDGGENKQGRGRGRGQGRGRGGRGSKVGSVVTAESPVLGSH